MNLTNLVVSQWLLKLYVPNKEKALVNSALFAFIFLFGRIIDGIADPIIGYLSDHLKSPRGRRVPFILYGGIPFALVYFLIWLPPYPGEQHWLNAVYVFALVQILFILLTIVVNPYLSLLPEISSDLKERVNISTWQAVFVMIGTIVFGLMGLVVQSWGWLGMGIVVAALIMISFYPTAFFVKEKFTAPQTELPRVKFSLIFEWIQLTFKNRAFVILVIATSFYWFALNMMIMLVPFWVQYVLKMGEQQVTLVMGPFLITNLLLFGVFNILAKKKGKYSLFLVTLFGSGLVMPLLYLVGSLPVDNLLATQICFGLMGIPVAGFLMLPFAILSDVVDYDETLTGKRREAIYFGVQGVIQKATIGISIAVATWLMYAGGDKLPTELGLKLTAVLSALLCLIGGFVFLKYPLRESEGKTQIKN